MRNLLLLMLLLVMAVPAAANDCGDGIPCGPLPDAWQLPALPLLRSPTPLPTQMVTHPNPLPGNTPTPLPTPTPPLDTSDLDAFIATAQAEYERTPEMLVDFDGTPIAGQTPNDLFPEPELNFWSYVRGLPETLATVSGPMSSTVQLITTAVLVTLASMLSTHILSMTAAIFGLLRRAWQMLPFT